MKNHLILLIPFFLILFTLTDVQAQRYGTAAGLRLGSNDYSRTLGLTAQQRILKYTTLEGIIQSDFSRNTTMHLLLEQHKPIISKRFNYYYGLGYSFGWEESQVKNPATMEIITTYGNATNGIDLIAGIEMTVLNTTISLDYKPNFNMSGREEFFRGQVGISARTVLVKSKTQDRKRRQKARAKRKKNRTPFFEGLKEKFKRN
ncbi:hypothetical protein SAMN06295967_11040 [Belliella buryatensis]|uniref:Outer membrane protein beta-barrel domain-containing protein n=1 Tax=Belliella buryatensis TaxID=1500549 RepID=A0A239ENE6_9BACT|nr:hypothetical protein [Belliella buryatensis]SNS46157.1 hypothetical protein SAMN06295967_11040 [Belliella buryatensis]